MILRLPFFTSIYCILFSAFNACTPVKIIQPLIKSESYSPADQALYREIISADNSLFAAFNARNITALKSHFADELEVYQDNTGLRNYKETVEAFTGLFKLDYVLTRTPIIESIEVYPIKNYGAIQTGKHTFCHTENGKLECATFKFVHIWKSINGQWKLAKIITYDHKL